MKKIYLNTLKPAEIIKRLKDGEVIHCNETTNIIKMIDGILCCCYKNKPYNIGTVLNIEYDACYFEEEEKFEITETGLYKTRDGQKVFVSDIDKYAFGVVEGKHKIFDWYLSGSFGEDIPNELDIVSKWED